MDQFVLYHGRQMRCGYTTGSCAAAASAAAVRALLSGDRVTEIGLMTPKGIALKLPVTDLEVGESSASCSVVKDSGDDPDVTNGIKVFAEVTMTDAPEVAIDGGEGVGRVTKDGLDQPVGNAAINSTPRRMIAAAVRKEAETFGYTGGFSVVISVPEGEKIAKKTFNPRLGIVGGISIIGTTGIVEPMSSRALVETIRTEAGVRKAEGMRTLMLTVGNYSERFIAERSPGLAGRCVTCSNFIGEAIDIGAAMGFERICVIGHLGKLVKLGSGIMNTHSHEADGRRETLMVCAALAGADAEVLRAIDGCVTTDAALDVLDGAGLTEDSMRILRERVGRYLRERVGGEVEIGAVIFEDKHGVTLMTEGTEEILEKAKKETEPKTHQKPQTHL